MKQRIKKQFWLSPQDARELKCKAKLCGITETALLSAVSVAFAIVYHNFGKLKTAKRHSMIRR